MIFYLLVIFVGTAGTVQSSHFVFNISDTFNPFPQRSFPRIYHFLSTIPSETRIKVSLGLPNDMVSHCRRFQSSATPLYVP